MFKVYPHEPKSLEWWHDQYVQDRVEMHPPYQRRSNIWSQWKKAHLVDSIINEFDIPKFYVADFTRIPGSILNKSKKPFAVIDGKQRLQALFDYLDDVFPLNQSATFEDEEGASIGGLKFSQLQARYPAASRKITSFIPAVMDVVTDEEDRLEEMFVRLNSGEHTTGAEKRNSMPGPVPGIIRELSVHPFFQRKIRFDKKRMQDLNLIAKLVLIERKNGFVDTKAKNLDELVRTANKELASVKGDHMKIEAERAEIVRDYMATQEKVYSNLELMNSVFHDKDPLLSNQGAIPVYYWLIRNISADRLPFVREFLLAFASAVKANLTVQRSNPDTADTRLSHYYTMGRTTNDQQSLNGRYAILHERFEAFAENAQQQGRLL